jgi:ATP phosphoribosyltransferase
VEVHDLKTLKLTLPKGSLEAATSELFKGAFYRIAGQERTYRPAINDPEIELKILRPQEIPVYVAGGVYDVGVTGVDWVVETGAKVERLLDLEYGKVRVVSAIQKSVKASDIGGFFESRWKVGLPVRISTEYLNLATRYLRSIPSYKKRFGNQEPKVVTPWWTKGKNAKAVVYLSFGATEAKPPEDADAIIDVTETGSSLEQNNLKIADTIMVSTAHLVSNRKAMADPWKREKIYDLMAVLKGVVEARKKVHIFLNVREKDLARLLRALPALKRPTISPLSEKGWYAVNTVVAKSELLGLIPVLRRMAQGLVVHEPEQVLPLEELGGSKND